MAKKKKTQNQPSTPESDPITPTLDLPQEEQSGALPETANPVGEVEVPVNPGAGVAEPNLPAATDAEAGDHPLHVNNVDTGDTGSGIVLAEVFGEMLDASAEEPGYPAHEWHGPAEPPLALPDEKASNETLIEGARRLVQIVGWRMRRTVQEWWLIGYHLNILKSRPENDGRWRTEILPEIGINHTTDYQLRAMAEGITYEACLNYENKSKLLREIGVLPPNRPKQLGRPQAAADGGGDPKIRVGIEDIFGLGADVALGFDGMAGACPTQAAPFDETEAQVGEETGPPVGLVADEEAGPGAEAVGKGWPKAETKSEAATQPLIKKAAPRPEAKVAAKAAPQPEEEDPIAVSEALVVTLGGAKVADLEAALSESPFAIIAKTEKRVVGLLWFAEDDYGPAKDKAGKALDKLRDVKKNFQVEARYLRPLEVIAL